MKLNPEDQGRAALVLDVVRRLFDDRVIHQADLLSVGINFGGSLTLGDHRLVPLIREAGRAEDCGTEAIDLCVNDFLNNTFGFGRWKHDPPVWEWQRGGGDVQLEALLDEEDAAIAERERLEAAMWNAWDEQQKVLKTGDSRSPATSQLLRVVAKSLDAATVVWEASCARERRARGAVCTRQSFLQERWLRSQAGVRA